VLGTPTSRLQPHPNTATDVIGSGSKHFFLAEGELTKSSESVLVLWVGETIGGIRLDAIVLKDAKMQARMRGCGRVRLNDQSAERTLGKITAHH
jgi:hypothetical protein